MLKIISLSIFTMVVAMQTAVARDCKSVTLKTKGFNCPELSKICLNGDVKSGQIMVFNKKSEILLLFSNPFCGTTHLDSNYCDYKSEKGLELTLYPASDYGYEFSGSIHIGTFPLKPGYIYSCEYYIHN